MSQEHGMVLLYEQKSWYLNNIFNLAFSNILIMSTYETIPVKSIYNSVWQYNSSLCDCNSYQITL